MPELPEVETTRKGISPHLLGHSVERVIVRDRRLRWPVPASLEKQLVGQRISAVERRGKYLMLRTDGGTAIIHLGMSGCLQIVRDGVEIRKHDHFDIRLDTGDILRFNDPRRFGCLLWTDDDAASHPLLANLGPEPLSDAFSGAALHARSRNRRTAIKPHVMNAGIVVGVGNIYANESLFRAGIHPKRAAGRISLTRMERLVTEIKAVLTESIRAGGTTLKDFYGGDGRPGYFRHDLRVYGREGQPCLACEAPIRQTVIGQRSTFFCVNCQH
jgi:formamidopyrimidine-DNA glycosylase